MQINMPVFSSFNPGKYFISNDPDRQENSYVYLSFVSSNQHFPFCIFVASIQTLKSSTIIQYFGETLGKKPQVSTSEAPGKKQGIMYDDDQPELFYSFYSLIKSFNCIA